jgi:electron transport complex protein RnfG
MTADPRSALPLRRASGGGAKPGAPPPGDCPPGKREILRIVASLTAACAFGAAILGAVYVATARYEEESRERNERRAISEMLGLDSTVTVVEVRQFLDERKREVVYRTDGAPRQLVFTLEGALVPAAEVASDAELTPLGRLFVAMRADQPAGFIVEGQTQGYKNVVRFLVALDERFEVAGVRVVQHEEDPGLGAEIATPWFQGQFVGRAAVDLANLDVARLPMPEDWRDALDLLVRVPPGEWRAEHRALLGREHEKPIYAVTGATISSRALTSGVGATVERFRRRWQLLAPYFERGGRS